MNADLLQGFYLGDLLVEPMKGQVVGRAGPRHLPPKAVEVLLRLADTPGEAVSHDVLLDAAWGAGNGSRGALNHTISELRHALDDHVDHPVFIQTLPKRGYRLAVAPQLPGDHAASIVLGAQGGASVEDIGLFESLHRRGVLETAVAYLILGWLLIQVADIVFAQLHFPQWAATFVTVLVIAGLPIALALSWFLEFRDGRAVLDDVSPADARKRRFSRTYISVIGSLAIAGVMVAIYDQVVGLPEGEPGGTPGVVLEPQLPPIVEHSFAVLPFMNLDGSRETQIFADGLVEDVLTQLSRVPGLRVASRGDSYALQPNSPSQEVRRRLRVQMYLEGSVEMNADEMRVTVQLINSEDGFHVLSRRFDKPREDFFQVRDDITSLTVANVRVALPAKLQASSLKVIQDPSLDAYVLYRQGIAASREPTTIDTIASALGWFDAALSVDPDYTAAHAAKCAVYVQAYEEMNDAMYIDNAESACGTALALNSNIDFVHTSLGDLYESTGQHDAAVAAYLEALESNPSSVDALRGLGIAYQHQNRLDEAEAVLRDAVGIHPGDASALNTLGVFLFQTGRYADAAEQYEYAAALEPDNMKYMSNLASGYMLQGNFPLAAQSFQKAIEITPTQMAYSNLGLMHYYMGDFDAAIESHLNAVELQPHDHLARLNLGDALWAAGRKDDARREFKTASTMATDALQVNPNDPFTIMDLAWIKANLGEDEAARKLIDRAIEMVPDDPYVHYINGLMLNRAGDTGSAIKALRTAVELGYSTVLLAGDPNIENLRADSHFSEITETP
jgi:tetratricopeptide (TPR) repeat protein/TolB-like protein/DNA-binding winged helix-turn-helix (wHTH) protein